jgi:vacuolar-type H+-ATPase subunit H
MAMDDVNKVGEQVSSFGNAAKEGITNAVERGRDLAAQAQTAAVQMGGTLRDAATEASKQAANAAGKAYEQGTQAADYVSRSTVQQPLLALLVAGAIGYAIAYMIHSR